MEFLVRKYEPKDRDKVRWICCETGFMGDPVEIYFQGRELFADMWTKYWTDYEPESAFVAEVNHQVVGYVMGALDTDRQEQIFEKEILPKIVRNFFFKGVCLHFQNWRYLRRVARSKRRGEFNEPMRQVKPEYPAHLHTNIAPPEFRGKGIGKALMKTYLDYLRQHKSKGVHLVTTSRNKMALGLYSNLGFKDLFRGPLTCYDHVLNEPLEKIGMGLKLE